MAKIKDLTVGSTKILLLSFALPTLLSNVFQQFYNLADTAIAGHLIGNNALVAIGASSSVYSLVFTFAAGLNAGFGIIFSQSFGAKNIKRLKSSVAQAVMINALFSIIICALSLIFIKPILSLMNTPAERMNDAYSYIIIILAFIIAPMLYNLEITVLRSLGDSKTPLYFLIFATVLNIILDYAFIKFLHMGVRGTAAATIVAQLTAVVLCFIVIKKNFKIIKLTKEDFKINKMLLKNMMSAGLAMAMMNSIFSIGSIIMQGAINSLGSVIITAHLGARKIAEMFMQPLVTIGMACSTFAGQNYGAGKISRITQAVKWSTVYGLIWSIFSFFILFFAGGQLAELITASDSQAVFENTQQYLKINAPFYFVLSLLFTLRFSIQSIDKKIPPLISSSMELISKIAAAFVFIPMWGYLGACIAEPLSWTLGAIYLLFAFSKTLKCIKEKNLQNKS